jgi:hypothetical protein
MSRSRLGRGLAVLALAALAVAVVSPAFSAAPLTKAKVKKIARKEAKKQINALVPDMISDLAVLKSNYVIFKETLTFGQEKTLTTNGPLTLVARCTTGAQDEIAIVVRSNTSEWWTTFDNEYTAPGEVEMHSNSVGTGIESYDTGADEPSVMALSGGQLYYIGIDDYKMGLGVNVLGHNCIVAGSAVVA